jgi:hypothetical protein
VIIFHVLIVMIEEDILSACEVTDEAASNELIM